MQANTPTPRLESPLRQLVFAVAAVSMLIATPPSASASDELETEAENELPSLNRRAEGLAFYDLPMRIRARFEATYMGHLTASDTLARRFAGDDGPGRDLDHSLQSRIAITRSLTDRVEIGLVLGVRSPVGQIGLFDFERQTVGAMIRIVP